MNDTNILIERNIESEKDFNVLFELMPQPMLLSEFDSGIIINANSAFCFTFGYVAKEIIGSPTSKLGIWNDNSRDAFIEALNENEVVKGIEMEGLNASNQTQYVLAFANVLYINSRKTLLSIAIDLNKQKETEQELRKNESKFKALFYNNAAPMAIYDLNTIILDTNDAYCRVCGFDREEVVGMSWLKQIPPLELERLIELNKKWLETSMDKHTEHDIVFLNKKGENTYVHMSSSYIPESNHIVRSFVDTTQRTIGEKKLAAKSEELKKLIEEKDKEITHNLLQIANSNQVLKQQQLELEQLRKKLPSENTELIGDVDKLIESNKANAKPLNWDNLKEHIKLTRPTFLSGLMSKHTDLSSAEQRLCTLLSLQLSTKEIATITNQHYDSIRVSRTRLRKKLNLKRSDNMVSYLMSL